MTYDLDERIPTPPDVLIKEAYTDYVSMHFLGSFMDASLYEAPYGCLVEEVDRDLHLMSSDAFPVDSLRASISKLQTAGLVDVTNGRYLVTEKGKTLNRERMRRLNEGLSLNIDDFQFVVDVPKSS